MKSLTLFVFVFCIVCAAANKKFGGSDLHNDDSIADPRIVHGHDAKEGQFLYQVSLRHVNGMRHSCGASIISSRFILTAAHCCQGKNSNPMFIVAVVGSIYRSKGTTVRLSKITPHEGYGARLTSNDIALIRTAGEIIFTDTVQPIGLPKQDLPDNIPLVVSGWGTLKYGGQVPENLQFTEPRSISLNECIERFVKLDKSYRERIDKRNLCTMNEETISVCNGDSGGPLAHITKDGKRSIVGIVSWNAPGCGEPYPDVFTRVYTFSSWIQKQIEDQNSV